MSKRELLQDSIFTPNVSFRLRYIFKTTDTDSLTLDISIILDPKSLFSDVQNGPRCGNVSPICHVLLLGEVTILITYRLIAAKTKVKGILSFTRSFRADINKGLRKYLVWQSGHRGRCQIACSVAIASQDCATGLQCRAMFEVGG